MKIKYRTKQPEFKIGDVIYQSELDSGELFVWDKADNEQYKLHPSIDWDMDRQIESIEIINNELYGEISDTVELYINLASLQKYRDENQI